VIEILIAILRSATPLIYVAMAGVVAQRAGLWHLGLEGLMLIGACASVVGIVLTGNYWLALLIAVLACVAASLLMWLVVDRMSANPIIAGLGITGLGVGGTAFAVESIFHSQAALSAPFGAPRIGEAFGPFGVLSVLVVTLPFVVLAMWVLLCRTRFGLRLAASGEHPFAARSVGVNPSGMKLFALALGGMLCAVGGAELATGTLQMFSQNMTAGRGFMAFAATVFGAAHPIWSALAATFFAVVGALGVRAQLAFGDQVPHDLVQALPYVATVLGVWLSRLWSRR
jgi:ABC-type uncharacterized transport system permease subunit